MNTQSSTAFSSREIVHHDQTYTIRAAHQDDIPFLAWMQYEASLPPANFSFWDFPLMGLGIESIPFIETVMRLNAGAWGSVHEFLILEHHGQPLAAAAGIEADADFSRGPVRVDHIDSIGSALHWPTEATETFRQRCTENWPDPHGNPLLLPQAPWIIESVAVVPAMRGKGLIRLLMDALLDEGRQRGHNSAGITIANGNTHAQHAYEKLGFQMYLAFGPTFFGEPGFGGYTKYKLSLV